LKIVEVAIRVAVRLGVERQVVVKRLVLGFDDQCSYCEDMASKIKERFRERLEIRDLHDPEVEVWRKQALGENPSWAPTLIELDGNSVRAWTGYRMGLALSWRLGPVATWRLTQALAEFRGHPEEQTSSVSGRRLTRGQFITELTKGIAGVALAVTVLGSSADPANAALCCVGICNYCYDNCGRRCGVCNCVRRCRERHSGCPCNNCRCRAKYC
jgi:hypothetical protein